MAARRLGRRADLAVATVALALAGWVTSGLWVGPNSRAITVNSSDQALFEWLLSYGAYALTHGENPLFTYLLNAPDGVNLAVNTSITVYAVIFAPLTFLIGPPATFLVILTLNLAGTGFAWYWLLSRLRPGSLGSGSAAGTTGRGTDDGPFVSSRLAAAVGGLFCGFAPAMVSHANAHLNWTAGWLVPIIVWRVLALRGRPGARPLAAGGWARNGLILGALVAGSFSIAAEGLFFTALACGVFLGVWALDRSRRAEVRDALPRLLRGLAVTAAVATTLLAYPLWLHFFGPQVFHGTGFDARVHSEDFLAYGAFPERSLAGVAGLGTGLAPNETEENSFFGVPLLVLTLACLVLLWRAASPGRRATLRALAVTGAVFTVLSWGPRLKFDGTITDIPLPYAPLAGAPIFNAALPARLAMVVTPIIGILLALAVDQLLRNAAPRRMLWAGAFAVALLPLIPVSLLTIEREPIPTFITSGAWRQHVSQGGVLAPVPFTLDVLPDGQRWQAHTFAHRQGEFAIPSGFFLGPGGPDGRGRIGPVPRATDGLLHEVARTGVVPPIDDTDRAAARADLNHWGAEAVVLADQVHGAKFPVDAEALLTATTELLGPPQRVVDVWLWPAPAGGW
ncbi:DUF2079 domain-containing protein [Micromonospora sp. NBC_01813]|uniref:DUF2079 domain-containing protein n=1 Tax=Micromonospora sp. NBC_01813 TaxID=2975988 RepID=UPI002DDB3887|nr:DUF2079 domain-containing protein [Micromonospora sp. NBC_01813]WSA12449.1 DUF2079 domain-containing protein [Micromonospora sp. NBC_01813]